jgi:hypothetical protein
MAVAPEIMQGVYFMENSNDPTGFYIKVGLICAVSGSLNNLNPDLHDTFASDTA